MEHRTVDRERNLFVEDAIALAERVARDCSIHIDAQAVLRSRASSAQTIKVIFWNDQGQMISDAMGKGLGNQALASGIFEAFEHAALWHKLPGQANENCLEVLPVSSLESIDSLYGYARHVYADRPQPVVEFQTVLGPEFELSDEVTIYPRTAIDNSLPLSEDLGKLLPLSHYASTTGYAAGTSLEDAVVHAVNELIERDAESQFILQSGRRTIEPNYVELGPDDHLFELYQELSESCGMSAQILLLDSVAGFVFAARAMTCSGQWIAGFGCSGDPEAALERALTELQQSVYADSTGLDWADEGGADLSNLNRFPRMRQAAEGNFALPDGPATPFARILSKHRGSTEINLCNQLISRGFPVLARLLWCYRIDLRAVYVVQVVVPGLERLSSLVFGRPLVPAGRLKTRANVDFLLSQS